MHWKKSTDLNRVCVCVPHTIDRRTYQSHNQPQVTYAGYKNMETEMFVPLQEQTLPMLFLNRQLSTDTSVQTGEDIMFTLNSVEYPQNTLPSPSPHATER